MIERAVSLTGCNFTFQFSIAHKHSDPMLQLGQSKTATEKATKGDVTAILIVLNNTKETTNKFKFN